ncbi:MAG TPA: FAD/NAD(P)-binding protein [Blastocatellia bacterium]|nr:FAD/NAD(P)-binding protein [Blastocatellia bacterium]
MALPFDLNIARSEPMLPRPFSVKQVVRDTHDTFTLKLQPKGESVAPAFAPGQFNMLYVFGAGEVPISISGDPSKPKTLVHTTRAVGMVTKAMSSLRRGDVIGVRGPFGSCWPLEESAGKDVVIVAGGIGLAPLRPAVYHLLSQREKYGKVALLYGTRSPNDILFKQELEQWRARFDFDVFVTVDRGIDGWRGSVGVVTTLIPRAPFDPAGAVALLCGPEVMMRFTVMELQKRGIAADRIYLSLERNMKCAVGFCGRCQFGPSFICKDGPVFRYDAIRDLFGKREI